jgi:hypothetical protein
MSKINQGNQYDQSARKDEILTSGASSTEISQGDMHGGSTRQTRIVDLPDIVPDLETLLARVNSVAEGSQDPKTNAKISDLRGALTAAKNDNESDLIKHLKGAGSWALEIATKVGADVAAAAIKASMGVG